MYCVHCGAKLDPADLFCTHCGKPKIEASSVQSSTPAPAPAPSPPGIELPPDLHWGLVILFNLITCGIFGIVWSFILAMWAKRLAPGNPAIAFVGAYAGGVVLAVMLSLDKSTEPFGSVVNLAGVICLIVGNFKIRAAMEEYYNSAENIGLYLSGVMTFFFGIIYFQYHINRLARWKKTGVLT